MYKCGRRVYHCHEVLNAVVVELSIHELNVYIS